MAWKLASGIARWRIADAGSRKMTFIVPPQKEEAQDRGCAKFITLCWQCKENPRACDEI